MKNSNRNDNSLPLMNGIKSNETRIIKSINPLCSSQVEFNSIAKALNFASSIKNIQDSLNLVGSVTKMISPTLIAQTELNSIFKRSTFANSIKNIQDSLHPINELSQLVNTKFETENIFQSKINEITNLEINKYFKTLMTDEVEDINEKNFVDESFQVLCEMNPDLNILKSSIDSTKYRKFIIVIIFIIISNSFNIYNFYNQLLDSDIHYKSNRDNVRVRLTPTKESTSNIITKLSKNTYVEKIGTSNGWINIKFELSDGVETDGWIYRSMLTKIEN